MCDVTLQGNKNKSVKKTFFCSLSKNSLRLENVEWFIKYEFQM